jgi:hypothetical protein
MAPEDWPARRYVRKSLHRAFAMSLYPSSSRWWTIFIQGGG